MMHQPKSIFQRMLGSWFSIAKHALEYSYMMSFETSCYNRRLKTSLPTIRINKDERDAIRFHWIKDCEILETEVFRFTYLMFELSPSPFVLKGTIKHYLE